MDDDWSCFVIPILPVKHCSRKNIKRFLWNVSVLIWTRLTHLHLLLDFCFTQFHVKHALNNNNNNIYFLLTPQSLYLYLPPGSKSYCLQLTCHQLSLLLTYTASYLFPFHNVILRWWASVQVVNIINSLLSIAMCCFSILGLQIEVVGDKISRLSLVICSSILHSSLLFLKHITLWNTVHKLKHLI